MDELKLVVVLGIVSAILLGIVVSAQGVSNYVYYKSQKAKIEQVRTDIKKIDKNNEDILGQATVLNQEIAKQQSLNIIFPVSILVPDGWDDIEKIDITEDN